MESQHRRQSSFQHSDIEDRTAAYQTHKNTRVQDLRGPSSTEAFHAETYSTLHGKADVATTMHSFTSPSNEGNSRIEQAKHNRNSTQPKWKETGHVQPKMLVLQLQFVDAFGPGGLSRISVHHHHDPATNLYGGKIILLGKNGETITTSQDPVASSINMATELLAEKAIKQDPLGFISAKSASSVAAEPSDRADDAQMPLCHPVSYVHQMCQVLLGTGAQYKPVMEAFKPEGASKCCT